MSTSGGSRSSSTCSAARRSTRGDYELLDLLPTHRSQIAYRHRDTGYVIHPDASFQFGCRGEFRWCLLEYERRATTVNEPCQYWVNELAIQEARLVAHSGYPEHCGDQARAKLTACEDLTTTHEGFSVNNRAFYEAWSSADFEANRQASYAPEAVRSFTYGYADRPRGWRSTHLNRQDCFRNWRDGETSQQYLARCRERGSFTPHAGAGAPGTPAQEHKKIEEHAEAEARVESIEGRPINWYRSPHGGGANRAIRVACAPNGNTLVRDASQQEAHHHRAPWVDSGSRPPAGQVCH